MLVISLRKAGSLGAGAVSDSRSSLNLRANSGGIFRRSKRLALPTSSVAAAVY